MNEKMLGKLLGMRQENLCKTLAGITDVRAIVILTLQRYWFFRPVSCDRERARVTRVDSERHEPGQVCQQPTSEAPEASSDGRQEKSRPSYCASVR